MKRIWVAGVLVMLALWLGFSSGYHFGRQNERSAWESNGVVVIDRMDGPPVVQSLSAVRGDWRQVEESKGAFHFYYRNPHSGIFISPAERQTENLPDPRSMLVRTR